MGGNGRRAQRNKTVNEIEQLVTRDFLKGATAAPG
jgi:hypothetical protein